MLRRILVIMAGIVGVVALSMPVAFAAPAPYNPPMPTQPPPKVWQTPPPAPPTDQPAPPSNAANRPGPGINAAVGSSLPANAKKSSSSKTAAVASGECGRTLGPWNTLYFQACDWPSAYYPGNLEYAAYAYNSSGGWKSTYYQTTTIRDGIYYNGPVKGPVSIPALNQVVLEHGYTNCHNANYTQVAVRIYSGYPYWSPWAYGPTWARSQTTCQY